MGRRPEAAGRHAEHGVGSPAEVARQAELIADKKGTGYKSMGLKITDDRIALLQQLNETESPVTINDLVNADGSAGGTEVLITLPVIYL